MTTKWANYCYSHLH